MCMYNVHAYRHAWHAPICPFSLFLSCLVWVNIAPSTFFHNFHLHHASYLLLNYSRPSQVDMPESWHVSFWHTHLPAVSVLALCWSVYCWCLRFGSAIRYRWRMKLLMLTLPICNGILKSCCCWFDSVCMKIIVLCKLLKVNSFQFYYLGTKSTNT